MFIQKKRRKTGFKSNQNQKNGRAFIVFEACVSVSENKKTFRKFITFNNKLRFTNEWYCFPQTFSFIMWLVFRKEQHRFNVELCVPIVNKLLYMFFEFLLQICFLLVRLLCFLGLLALKIYVFFITQYVVFRRIRKERICYISILIR